MRISKKSWMPALLSVLMCAGCSIFSKPVYTEVADYDLLIPDKVKITPVVPVRFGVFSNLSGSGMRMLRRDNTGKVRVDEYNRWLLLPEQLYRRGMLELMETASDSEAKWQIHCRLLRFEVDSGKAVLEAEYLLRGTDRREEQRIYRFETALKGSGGAAVAAAMSENLLKSVRKLNQEISAISARKGGEDKR